MDVSVTVSEQLIPIAQGALYTKRWAPNSSTTTSQCPIVLFHDSLGCVEMWRHFPASLAQRLLRPVIAYDRLGFGQSSRRLELPSARFVSEESEINFPQLKDRLGLRDFIVLGHSVGGAMAALVAARYPLECRAVVRYHGDKANWVVNA
jgi:pimeloyl-ACP methyl ester carboxylesterase